MKELLVLILVAVVIGTLFITSCTEDEPIQQQNQTHEGVVVAVAPVLGGSFTNTYIAGAIVYFQDGSKVMVASNLDLLIGSYYIITTIPPINEYWTLLVIDSIIYKPEETQ